MERAREGEVGVVGVREGAGTEGEGRRNTWDGDGVPICEGLRMWRRLCLSYGLRPKRLGLRI